MYTYSHSSATLTANIAQLQESLKRKTMCMWCAENYISYQVIDRMMWIGFESSINQ